MTEELLARLHAVFDDKENSGPVSESTIEDAERLLGVAFPPSYRAFLRAFGASLHVAPYEISGLPPTDRESSPLWSSVVVDTLALRSAAEGMMTDHVAISGDGGDYTLVLGVASGASPHAESPVFALGPGLDYVQVASSFVDFAERANTGDSLATWRT